MRLLPDSDCRSLGIGGAIGYDGRGAADRPASSDRRGNESAMTGRLKGESLARRIYERMLAASGPRAWWPCDRRGVRRGFDEIVIGAVLTQNTSWKNVERALATLREAGLIDLEKLALLDPVLVAPHIRSSGYFNIKSRRLGAVARFFAPDGGLRLEEIAGWSDLKLREELLGIAGVGPETADSIMLYALERTSFVIDAYTMRIGRRHGLLDDQSRYEEARRWFSERIEPDRAVYNEYHALLVWVGNRFCRPMPRCEACPLSRRDCFADSRSWRAMAPWRAQAGNRTMEGETI